MIGRGIAFGKRKGQLIDPSAVEQTFVPEQGMSGERLSMTLSEIPAEILSIATLLESKVRAEGALELSNSFILPLADHLHYAVVRARDGVRVPYPLAPEVTVLYPREVEYGRTGWKWFASACRLNWTRTRLPPWRCTWSTRNLRRRICLRHSA